jgi:uncharacterized RDD family membrane protein YckC
MSDETSLVPQVPLGDWADPWARPELFQGVTLRRILACAVDWGIVLGLTGIVWFAMLLLGLLSFGLLAPLLPLVLALVPLVYHIGLIAGPDAATLGMRLFGLRVVSITALHHGFDGRPTPLQAIIQIVSFYGSVVMSGGLILVVALFNSRRRTLHDWLAGTVVMKLSGPLPYEG